MTPESFARHLAEQLHAGVTWVELARSARVLPKAFRDRWRDAVQPHALALADRDMPPTSHRSHGTPAMYVVEGCRCEPCRYSIVLKERERGRKHRRGLVPYVDADPVRAHLAWLSAEGVGWQRASRLAGVHNGVVWKIIYGDSSRGMAPSKRVRRRTADRILAVQPTLEVISDGAYIPADATWALIRWLLDKGATRTWIASQIAGRPVRSLQLGADRVTGANARAVRRLVDDVRAGRVQIEGRRSRWDTREEQAA